MVALNSAKVSQTDSSTGATDTPKHLIPYYLAATDGVWR